MSKKRFSLASDASSIILLQKIKLLREIYRGCELFITSMIQSELLMGASNAEAEEIKQHTIMIDPIDIHNLTISSALTSADASVLHLYVHTNSDAVLSDDQAILKYCSSKNIDHYCCLSLLSPLVEHGVLLPHSANNFFAHIESVGRYSTFVINYARAMLDESISKYKEK